MLKLSELSKKFGNNEVLKNIDLTIDKGNVYVIIGPSGTGKSTLLRCINYLEKPDKGTSRFQYNYKARNSSVENTNIDGFSEF